MEKLSFLALAACASGLQVESESQLKAATKPGVESKSALLVVSGLTRHFDISWPKLVKSVLEPNEEAGYTFTIVMNTDLGKACVPGSSRFSFRKCEEAVDRDWHLKRIETIFAPRTLQVVDDASPCSQQRDRSAMLVGAAANHTTSDFESLPCEVVPELVGLLLGAPAHQGDISSLSFRPAPCAPFFQRTSRVLRNMAERGQRFDRVVALRPDVVVHGVASGGAGRVEYPQLLLDRMCSDRPGFSFVTPSWKVQRRSYLHNRDLDFLHILCPGSNLKVYEEATHYALDGCHLPEGESPPPKPQGFHPTKRWKLRAYFCEFVRLLTQNGINISHWDDTYTMDWLDDWEIHAESA